MGENILGRPAQLVRYKFRKPYWYVKLQDFSCFLSTHEKTKAGAQRVALQWVAEKKLQQKKHRQNCQLLKSFAKDFYKEESAYILYKERMGKKASSSHLSNCQYYLNKHILSKFGDYEIEKINSKEVEDWLVSLELSNQSKNHLMTIFKQIMTFAVHEGKCSLNALKNMEPFANNYKPRHALKIGEIPLLFPKDINELISIWGNLRFACYYSTLLYTGIRESEALALKWSDIEIKDENNYLIINKSIKESQKIIGKTKTGMNGLAYIPLPLNNILNELKNSIIDFSNDNFIFANQEGNIPVRREISRRFKEVLKKRNIENSNGQLVPHSLRHTYTSVLQNYGVESSVVSLSTQHTQEKTMRRYTHTDFEDKERKFEPVIEKIENIWAKI